MLKVLNDYDWEEVFGFSGEDACNYGKPYNLEGVDDTYKVSEEDFTREDVEKIYGLHEGENDEEDWLIAGKLNDGRYFMIEAGCDYTGWD
jgi:hypothetical protein